MTHLGPDRRRSHRDRRRSDVGPVFLRTSEAAALIGIAANTLRAWERRYDLTVKRTADTKTAHRRYERKEVLAIRDAVAEGLLGESAVTRAKELVASGRYDDPPAVRARIIRLEKHVVASEKELMRLREAIEELTTTINGLVLGLQQGRQTQ